MTKEQAEATAAAQNATIGDSVIVSVVNRRYNNLFNESYFVQFIPKEHQVKFKEAPDLDVSSSFARVNIKASAFGSDDYVAKFNSIAADDAILSPYLFPKK